MFSQLLLTFGAIAAVPLALADVDLNDITLPPGFEIEVYADVPHARSMSLGEGGTVYVSTRRATSVYAVVPAENGSVDVIELVSGLTTPNGVAFFEGDLYVAEIARILRFENVSDRLTDMPEPEVLPVELPGDQLHGWRYIGFGPDRKLYVAIGAPCNICDRGDEGYAQIIRMNPDGSGREAYAVGIRNSVGFTWHPDTDELWFTDNGRDMLGDDLPAGELNHASHQGMHFGYPYCHGGDLPDPELGEGRDCSDYTAPAQKLGPHVAALGVKFYDGEAFPVEYREQAFLAEHGSWNRSEKIGYRVSLVRFTEGVATSYEVFAEGWLQGQEVSGRPVDILVLDDGSMLVSDDYAGKIYRIRYEGQ